MNVVNGQVYLAGENVYRSRRGISPGSGVNEMHLRQAGHCSTAPGVASRPRITSMGPAYYVLTRPTEKGERGVPFVGQSKSGQRRNLPEAL